MAEDFRDLRAKISVEADAALDVISRVTGRERSELVRDILHKWAAEQLHIASLLKARMDAEGLTGASGGGSGSGNAASGRAGR